MTDRDRQRFDDDPEIPDGVQDDGLLGKCVGCAVFFMFIFVVCIISAL